MCHVDGRSVGTPALYHYGLIAASKLGCFTNVALIALSIRIVGNGGDVGKVRSRIEWRIDVDQIHLPRELLQQRRQHVLLVPPDEPVAPLRRLARREQVLRPVAVCGGLVTVSTVWNGSAMRGGATLRP